MPLGHPDRDEGVVGLVEPFELAEPGGRRQRALQRVHPRVVRAPDGPEVAVGAGFHELVPAVAAHVVEGPERAGLVPDEQDALPADPHRLLVTRRVEIVDPADTGPGSLEEPLLFPGEHLGRQIGLGRERAVRSRRMRQHRLELRSLDRRGYVQIGRAHV